MIETAPLHRYRLFGLVVASELALPELMPAIGPDGADVVVANSEFADRAVPNATATDMDETLLEVPGVASYKMLDGKRILVDRHDGASERDVRLFLLGSAFAAILHQRGMLPLHCSAIEMDGQAVAFLGHSGAGKSTLATWFHDRGHGILSDDVCVVDAAAQGHPVAHAGVPRLRLWRDALEASGRATDGQERAFRNLDKYNVRTIRQASSDQLPLSHIYVIRRDEESRPEASIDRMSGARAVEALVTNTYRGRYVRELGSTQRHLDQCVRLAQRVAVYEVHRPWSLGDLDQVGAGLEIHARAKLAGGLALRDD